MVHKVEPDKETEKVSSPGGRNGVPEYFKKEGAAPERLVKMSPES